MEHSQVFKVVKLKRIRSTILCKCGCGRQVNLRNGRPNKFIKKHHYFSGEQNPFYGKKHTKESLAKISAKVKKWLSTPINHSMFGKHHTEEAKTKISKTKTGVKSSDAARKAISRGKKGKGLGKDNPMYGRKLTTWHKQQISKANKNKTVSAETRAKMSKNNCMHRLKTDKVFRKRWVAAVAKGVTLKPNESELQLNELLQNLFPREYKYVGDFQFWLGGKNPDFMNINGKKKLIELFGNYWHAEEDEGTRANHFNNYGFECLIIWERELQNTYRLTSKLKTFHHNL